MLECLHNEPFKSLWRPASAKPSILAHCKQAPGAQVHHMLHQDFPNPNSSTASAESQRGAPRSPALRTLRLMVMSRTKKGLVRTFPHHLASPPQRAAQGEVPAQPLEVHGACQEAAAVLGPIHTRPALPVFRAVKEKHKLSEGMGALKVGECLRPGGGVLSQLRRQADGSPWGVGAEVFTHRSTWYRSTGPGCYWWRNLRRIVVLCLLRAGLTWNSWCWSLSSWASLPHHGPLRSTPHAEGGRASVLSPGQLSAQRS